MPWITIQIQQIRAGYKVRIGIEAPDKVTVHRGEVQLVVDRAAA